MCRRVPSVLNRSKVSTRRRPNVFRAHTHSMCHAFSSGSKNTTSVRHVEPNRIRMRSSSSRNESKTTYESSTKTPYGHFNMTWLSFDRVVSDFFFFADEYTMNCTAITRQGQQCKLRALQGSSTCFRHTSTNAQCPVCLMDMTAPSSRTLDCGHTFHSRCVERWKRVSRTCPMCREPFDQPMYKIRVSIQRMADRYVSTETYTTSNITSLVNTFGMDPMIDPRFLTDILFEIAQNESVSDVLKIGRAHV